MDVSHHINAMSDAVMQSPDSAQSDGERQVERLGARQKQLIRQSLTARFAAFLKPGEALEVDAELSDEYVYGTVAVTSADDSFRLDVEAAILSADQDRIDELDPPEAYLELAIEFLKLQLYEFFRRDRDERFHVDWRLYPVEKATIRFRGQVRRPDLERRADELLEDEELPEAEPPEASTE